ncbi:MAG: DUF4388 domain-containing protein [Gemmatimonadales bacterium]
MHGPLSEISLVEVLQLLQRGQRSGTLRVTGPDPTAPRTLWLREGVVVALEPEASDAAVDEGLIARALASTDLEDGPLTVAASVRDALRSRLASAALGAMLHWSRGRFDFSEGPVPPGPLNVSPDALVLDVVESEMRRVDLAGELDEFRAVPAFVPAERLGVGEVPTLDPLDWRLLDAVDGIRNVAALAAALDEPLDAVAERVRSMQGAAILQLAAAPADIALEARAAIEAGRYNDAAQLLRTRVDAVPGDGEAWRTLGLAEVGAGRFDRAIGAWEAWRAADPTRAEEAASLTRAAQTMVEALRDTRD